MLPRISKQSVHQFQQLLWIVAVNHVISPCEFALRWGEGNDRQLWQVRLYHANHVFRVEILYSAMQYQGINLGKHVKQVHRLLFGVGGNHIEFEGFQQQLAR